MVTLVHTPSFSLHSGPSDAFERPERITAIYDVLQGEELIPRLTIVPPIAATDVELLAAGHTEAHIARVDGAWGAKAVAVAVAVVETRGQGQCQAQAEITLSESEKNKDEGCEGEWAYINAGAETTHGTSLKDDTTYVCSGSAECARLSAGAVGTAVKAVSAGSMSGGGSSGSRYAFALCRPPGHHAGPELAHGFCLYNNAAVGVGVARDLGQDGFSRVAVVDWDVHHGDGMQAMMEAGAGAGVGAGATLYVSIHRHDSGKFFPYTGAVVPVPVEVEGGHRHRHRDGGVVNIPLPCTGCGDDEYMSIFDRIVMPLLTGDLGFNPDLILISAGFDIMEGDYVGRMCVSPAGIHSMTRKLMEIGVPVVALLEGGYNMAATAYGVAGCLRAMLGDDVSECTDPYEGAAAMRGQGVQSRVHAAVSECIESMREKLGLD